MDHCTVVRTPVWYGCAVKTKLVWVCYGWPPGDDNWPIDHLEVWITKLYICIREPILPGVTTKRPDRQTYIIPCWWRHDTQLIRRSKHYHLLYGCAEWSILSSVVVSAFLHWVEYRWFARSWPKCNYIKGGCGAEVEWLTFSWKIAGLVPSLPAPLLEVSLSNTLMVVTGWR